MYTPEPVRTRVIALHMSGQSNRQIAREERIDRETVSRILSQREVAQKIAGYQSDLLSMVPKALKVYRAALASGDERVRVATATKLLEGLQVLSRRGMEQGAPEENAEQQKYVSLGQMMEMLLEKRRRYAIPLPPEFDEVEKEVNERATDEGGGEKSRESPLKPPNATPGLPLSGLNGCNGGAGKGLNVDSGGCPGSRVSGV